MPQSHLSLTPDALTMIDTIERTGSFAAAARELGKVPSALTYSVRQLEESLDVLLFDRRSRQARFTAAGTVHLGRSACLEVEGIRINVVSGQCQMLDLDLFRFLGVEPEAMKLLVNKSSVHFRAAFAPIASHILVAVAPGPMAADPAMLPWRHLGRGIALKP